MLTDKIPHGVTVDLFPPPHLILPQLILSPGPLPSTASVCIFSEVYICILNLKPAYLNITKAVATKL